MTRLSGRLPYLPGLDGLRALAVIAVLLYHAELRWAPVRFPGGFLGVEVFFVLSGYLITSLLLAEWRQRDGIDLKGFWLRRARRLLPAVFALLVGVLVFAVVFLPDEIASLRKDALASMAYVTNWYLVFDHQSYFESLGRPSLLRHLWSLAIEEQFYLLWPPLFAVGMRTLRRRYVAVGLLAAAAASAMLMAALYQPGIDPSRIYYGTDTRASGLLVGAALAFVWTPEMIHGSGGRAPAVTLDVAGLVALAALVYFFVSLGQGNPLLYQGGFALVALSTATVIAVAVHPRARLGPLLGQQPLRWIGLRSYSIYLWHWPVFMLTRPHVDVPLDGPALLLLRLAITGVLAEISYRFVETPIRAGALRRAWAALRSRPAAAPSWLGVRWAAAAGSVALLPVALGVAVMTAKAPNPPSYLTAEAVEIVQRTSVEDTGDLAFGGFNAPVAINGRVSALEHEPTEPPPCTPEPTPQPTAPPTPEPTAPPTPQPTAPPTPNPTPPPPPPPSGGLVTAIGDSVMLGATAQLSQAIGNLDLYAEVGIQVAAGTSILRQKRDAGTLGSAVVIHLGNNGSFTVDQFDEIMQVLAEVDRVVFVNVKVPRPWEGSNNAMLAANAGRYPNAALADWHGASAGHPEYFWDDGIHLRPEGAQAYTSLIIAHL